MAELGEAVEGVVALIMGGFILLLIGSPLESAVNHNLSIWGTLIILLGILTAVAVAAAIVGNLIGR